MSLSAALRSLLRAPGFAVIAVLTLALGVGTTTSIFSVINGSMLNLLPWRDTHTIVSIDAHRPKHDAMLRDLTYGQFSDLQASVRSYSGLVANQWELAYLTDRDEPAMVPAARATVNAFEVMGVEPLLGRAFVESDGKRGAEPVALLSEQVWTDRYGADPGIVGRSLEIDGEPTTIIGIIATARWFPNPGTGLVRPLILDQAAPARIEERLGVMGRLAPGVELAQAQAELDLVSQQLAERYPATDANSSLSVALTRDLLLSPQAKAGNVFLLAAVGFLLLIVCANLAGLLLARGTAREKEIATRAAIGASRAQIVSLLLSESLVIALVALPFALLITFTSREYMLSLVPDTVTYMAMILRIDWRVLTFASLTMLATVLVFGLYPALKATAFDLNSSLKAGGNRGSTSGGALRLRSALVAGQIALAVALLATSALFMAAFTRVQSVDLGFETQGVLAAHVALPDTRYADVAKIRDLQSRLSAALEELPSNAQAALVSLAPLGFEGTWRELQIVGRETTGSEATPNARWLAASSDYFDTLGLRVLEGRGLTASDGQDAQPVAVVTKAFAAKYFPNESAVGKRIDLLRASGVANFARGQREIVGVVTDVKSFMGLDAPVDQPRIYEPLAQQPTPTFHIVVRTRGDEQSVSAVLRERVRAIDPLLAINRIETMNQRFETLNWQSTFFIRLMTVLGLLALLLSAVGLYGVIEYSTRRRTRELGIRAALGAEPRQLASLVMRTTLGLAAWGSGAGVLLAVLGGHASRKVLYESEGQNPVMLGGVLLVLLLVVVVATAVPTLRATRVNPADCLRAE